MLFAYYFIQAGFSEGIIAKLDYTVADIVHAIGKPFSAAKRNSNHLRKLWSTLEKEELLHKVLISFSDQQLVTGFAMLVVGYAQVNTISEYHFDIVNSLTALAFIVHDCSSSVLRDHAASQHRVIRTWRGSIVLLYMELVLVTALPLVNQYWLQSYGMPTVCVWASFRGNYNPHSRRFWNMIITMGLQLWGICSTFNDYFPERIEWVIDNPGIRTCKKAILTTILLPRKLYRHSLSRLEESLPPVKKALWKCIRLSSSAVAVAVFAACEVLHSEAFELQRHCAMLVNSIFYIHSNRVNASYLGREGNENAWGFGQAVPVFLLVLPLSTILEAFVGTTSRLLVTPRRGNMSLTHVQLPIRTRARAQVQIRTLRSGPRKTLDFLLSTVTLPKSLVACRQAP